MLRGEFIRGDGLVIPNNITTVGAKELLQRAIQGVVAFDMFVALVAGVFTPELQVDDLEEPVIGTGGYARIDLLQSPTDWPTVGQVNGEWYIESKPLVWAAVAVPFSAAITRMAIVDSESDLTGDVFALSGALPGDLTITPETEESDRTFRYRIYLR